MVDFFEIKIKEEDTQKDVYSYVKLATEYQAREDIGKAISFYEKSLKICEELGDIPTTVAIYNYLGFIFKVKGRHDIAISYYTKGLELAQETNYTYGAASISANMGNIYRYEERWDKATKYYQKSLSLFQKVGDVPKVRIVSNILDLLPREREL